MTSAQSADDATSPFAARSIPSGPTWILKSRAPNANTPASARNGQRSAGGANQAPATSPAITPTAPIASVLSPARPSRQYVSGNSAPATATSSQPSRSAQAGNAGR